MPYAIAIVFFNFRQNGSFRRFRHFGWGLWTLSSLRKITQNFFGNFRQNCCFRQFSWGLWTLSCLTKALINFMLCLSVSLTTSDYLEFLYFS